MKLHHTTIERLVKIFENYGGWSGEQKLRRELSKVDLSTYQQQKTGAQVIVLTEELEKYRNS